MKIEDEILNFNGICIIDFWAPWCGPCKMFAPIFDKISNEYENIKFTKINVDENKELCKKYGILSIPTTIVLKKGIEIKKHIGFMDEDSFTKFIDNI